MSKIRILAIPPDPHGVGKFRNFTLHTHTFKNIILMIFILTSILISKIKMKILIITILLFFIHLFIIKQRLVEIWQELNG